MPQNYDRQGDAHREHTYEEEADAHKPHSPCSSRISRLLQFAAKVIATMLTATDLPGSSLAASLLLLIRHCTHGDE